MSARADIPYYLIFILFALLLTWFSAVRRRVEQQLLESRDTLQREIVERTQQASLLNLTHDTIFVRDMNDIITYWNRGAAELYGWTEDQAVGKNSHQLLQTDFPLPIDEVREELLRNGRGKASCRRQRPTDPGYSWPADGLCARMSRAVPSPILETNNDISDRKHREEEIRKLNQELEKRTADLEASNKELEAFAYSVSHDLRAPLRHMVGYTELLQKNVGLDAG